MAHSPAVPRTRNRDFEVWMEQARHGSPEALGLLLQTCRHYLLVIANHNVPQALRARLGASDLVQDTLMEAQRDFDQFHGTSEEELQAWLVRLLSNNLANVIRDQRDTAKRDLGREIPLAEVAPGELAIRLAAATARPGDPLLAQERDDRLHQAMDRLPERSRQVIQWRNYERCTFKEIGERLECSEEAARKVWVRILSELQRTLESWDEST